LLGKGDFVAVAEGKVHRFQAAFIAPDEAASLVKSLRKDAVLPLATQDNEAAIFAGRSVAA
jgi:hypothetical protein